MNFSLESKIKTDKIGGQTYELQFPEAVFTASDMGMFATTEMILRQKCFNLL